MAKKGVIILIIILVVALCAAGVIIAINNKDSGSGTPSGDQQKKPGFDTGAGAFKQQIEVVDRLISIPGWETLTIPANKTDVIVDFYNPQENEGKYHMTFALRLNGETLYESGLVRAGDHIQNITLSRPLAAGTYDAVLHVQPYTADDNLTPTNNADLKIKLIVS